VRASLNPKLAIEGLVLTMYDVRNNLALQVAARRASTSASGCSGP
jgi:hypothetical protein